MKPDDNKNNDLSSLENISDSLSEIAKEFLDNIEKTEKNIADTQKRSEELVERATKDISRITKDAPGLFDRAYEDLNRTFKARELLRKKVAEMEEESTQTTKVEYPKKDEIIDSSKKILQGVMGKVSILGSRIKAEMDAIEARKKEELVGEDSHPQEAKNQEAKNQEAKNKEAKPSKIPENNPSKNSNSTNTLESNNPSKEIIEKMDDLLFEMTGKREPHSNTWSDLDKLSAHIKHAWVGVLSKGKNSNAADLLEKWAEIVSQINKDSKSWPHPHSASWKKWSEEKNIEIEKMRPWLTPNSALLSKSGVAKIPKAPESIPTKHIKALQLCADFVENNKSNQNIKWENTPAKYEFQDHKKSLEMFTPKNKQESDWKEEALDLYAIMEGKLALATVKKPTNSNKSKNSKKPK